MTVRHRPRQPSGSGLFDTERAPRLVLRFIVVLSLSLALASGLILVVVHHFAVTEAERSATKQAGLIASTVLQREVKRDDFLWTVSDARRRELDKILRPLVSEDTLRVSLVRTDGEITYSTDHRLVGRTASARLSSDAAAGTIVSIGTRARELTHGHAPRTLDTYVPVTPGHGYGAVLIVQSYAPIERAARAAQLRVGGVLEALLLVLFLVFVPLLARVTKRIGAQIDHIHFQAFYDTLTCLPNRVHLFERLEVGLPRAATDGRKLAVLVVDLDRFREVNNTLGHAAGDELLAETARRLRIVVRDEWLLARLGGDEFAIVIEYTDDKDVKTFADCIRMALEPPASVHGLPLAVGSTVGIAFFPKDGSDAATLVKHAEVATYTAKEWHVGVLAYSPAVDPHDPDQLELVGELQDAAERGEIRPRYQPMIDMKTGAIVGFEALAYWEHPSRGLIPPGSFVPIAERTGAIRHVTRAMLLAAVQQLNAWDSLDLKFTVAVNLTAIDLVDPKLPSQLRGLLRKHDIEPDRLCIELTERTVVTAPDKARSILKRIVAAGIRVSIDDFGTGHSSLAHLKNLPVHEMKIDRSFVSDMIVSPHDRMIVLAAIQLGHSLGLRVVAEGVESSAVHDALRDHGCDYAQGYLYGRPEPADVATSAIANHNLQAA